MCLPCRGGQSHFLLYSLIADIKPALAKQIPNVTGASQSASYYYSDYSAAAACYSKFVDRQKSKQKCSAGKLELVTFLLSRKGTQQSFIFTHRFQF